MWSYGRKGKGKEGENKMQQIKIHEYTKPKQALKGARKKTGGSRGENMPLTLSQERVL